MEIVQKRGTSGIRLRITRLHQNDDNVAQARWRVVQNRGDVPTVLFSAHHVKTVNRETIQMHTYSHSHSLPMVNWLRIVVRVGRYVVENAWVEACWVCMALLYLPSWNDAFGIETNVGAMPGGVLPCILCNTFGGADMRWEELREFSLLNESVFVWPSKIFV